MNPRPLLRQPAHAAFDDICGDSPPVNATGEKIGQRAEWAAIGRVSSARRAGIVRRDSQRGGKPPQSKIDLCRRVGRPRFFITW